MWKSGIFVLSLVLKSVLCQEFFYVLDSHAVQEGEVDVLVRSITLEDFQPRLDEFRETVAFQLSVYCKRAEGNCWAQDKQIRRHDVVIQYVKTAIDSVSVRFHVRDRYDHLMAGMQNQQVRKAFGKVGTDIEDIFGKPVELVSPEKVGMPVWMIAVIAVCSVVGVALIITIVVLGCKQCEARGKRATREKLIEEQLRRDYSLTHTPPNYLSAVVDDKENPGYDSDSSASSHGSQEPGTSRSNSTENSPPPDYNGYSTGQYQVAPPVPTKSALYDSEMTNF